MSKIVWTDAGKRAVQENLVENKDLVIKCAHIWRFSKASDNDLPPDLLVLDLEDVRLRSDLYKLYISHVQQHISNLSLGGEKTSHTNGESSLIEECAMLRAECKEAKMERDKALAELHELKQRVEADEADDDGATGNNQQVMDDKMADEEHPQQALSALNDREDNNQAGGQQAMEDAKEQGQSNSAIVLSHVHQPTPNITASPNCSSEGRTLFKAEDAQELGKRHSVLKGQAVQRSAYDLIVASGWDSLSPQNNAPGKTLLQDLWAYFAKLGGLGDCSSGMSGTCSKKSAVLVLQTIQKEMGGHSYEFIDIGAGSGVMVALSLCFGASSAGGIELKNEGQESVYLKSKEIFVRHGIDDPRMLVSYGVDVSSTSALPSYSWSSHLGNELKRAVYSFCDGFAEVDRCHMFSLIGKDKQVKLFICSLGKGRGDKFSNPQAVEESINSAAASAQNVPFTACAKLVVHMYGSGAQKTVHVFRRI